MRLARGADDARLARKYVDRAKKAIIYDAASTAWSKGVPWAEALQICETAVAKASAKPRAIPKAKAVRAKAKPKAARAKPKARAG